MPPELFEGRNVCGKSQDIFALGIILFYLIVGKYPFQIMANPELDQLYRIIWEGQITEWLIIWGKALFPDKASSKKQSFEMMKEFIGLDAMTLLGFLLAPEPSMRLSIEEIIAIQYFQDQSDEVTYEEIFKELKQ